MIAEAVNDILTTDTNVTALVGQKIYLELAKATADEDLPHIVYFIVDEIEPAQGLLTDGGLTETRVQVDCWGKSYIQVRAITRAVSQALKAASGTYGDTVIQTVRFDGSRGTYLEPTSGKNKGIHGISSDFIFASHDA